MMIWLSIQEFDYIKLSHDDQWGDPGRIRWAGRDYGRPIRIGDELPPIQEDAYPDATDPPDGAGDDRGIDHGTGILSKIIGKRFGAAKSVNVVMVREPYENWLGYSNTALDFAVMLQWYAIFSTLSYLLFLWNVK